MNPPNKSIPCYEEIKSFLDSGFIKLFKKPLVTELNKYTPFNEQEKKDQELFLKYIDMFPNDINKLLVRENTLAHFSSSAFVVNKTKDKMLVVYHKILDGLIYPGGHADGEEDLLSVAIREVEEETGQKATPLYNSFFSIQALPIAGHIKNGKYVSSHIHFDVIFLLEADDTTPLTYRKDESKGVKWITFSEAILNKDIIKFIIPIHSKLICKFLNLNV